MARTAKPCPGCGWRPLSNGPWREAGKVCDNCAALIEEALDRRKELACPGDTDAVVANYDTPRFPHVHFDEGERLTDAMMDTLRAVGDILWLGSMNPRTIVYEDRIDTDAEIPEPESNYGHVLFDRHYRTLRSRSTGQVALPRNVADALHNLFDEMVVALHRAEAEGWQRGRSALLGLAQGDLTLNDFEQGSTPP